MRKTRTKDFIVMEQMSHFFQLREIWATVKEQTQRLMLGIFPWDRLHEYHPRFNTCWISFFKDQKDLPSLNLHEPLTWSSHVYSSEEITLIWHGFPHHLTSCSSLLAEPEYLCSMCFPHTYLPVSPSLSWELFLIQATGVQYSESQS